MQIHVDVGPLTRLRGRLRDITGRGQRQLITDIEDYARAANRYDTLDELDRFGNRMPKWRVRQGRYRGLTGPTMAAHGMQSDRIAGFYVVPRVGSGGFTVDLGFRASTPEKAMAFAAHAAGAVRGAPRRDILGTPEPRVRRIQTMIREHYRINP